MIPKMAGQRNYALPVVKTGDLREIFLRAMHIINVAFSHGEAFGSSLISAEDHGHRTEE
jgi:hypothetical protein